MPANYAGAADSDWAAAGPVDTRLRIYEARGGGGIQSAPQHANQQGLARLGL